MFGFKEFVANAPGDQQINPERQKLVTQYIQNTLMPGMQPVEKAKFLKIFNPNSQLIIPFWQQIAQSGFNVGKISSIARRMENDPSLAKTAPFIDPDTTGK